MIKFIQLNFIIMLNIIIKINYRQLFHPHYLSSLIMISLSFKFFQDALH